MVATLTRQTGSAGALVSTNTWFTNHDRLDVVANTLAGASTSAYDYAVNALGQRTSVAASGSAFSGITGASWSSWGYNHHGEVTGATHSTDSTRNRLFVYDSIGNRKHSRNGSSTGVGYLVNTPNSTNKYTELFNDPNGNGAKDSGETTIALPVHDEDGNMTDDDGSATTGRTFIWDAENRLIQVKDKSTTPKLLATYTYDYRGRRVKKVTTADAVQGPTQIAYLYDGWNVIAEPSRVARGEMDGAQRSPKGEGRGRRAPNQYDLAAGNPSASPTKRHDWGLDLSGSLQGAGGVGGLIRTKIGSTSYFPTYDGNGNVCELINASDGTFGARYHYDPFGNTIYESGSAAISNLYRFSSKPVDRESGFYYYGYRYYDTVRGRWINRDPIAEGGGLNVYSVQGNNFVSSYDILGLYPGGRPTVAGQPSDPPEPPSDVDRANAEFDSALGDLVTGRGGVHIFGPNHPWTREMRKRPVYERMRNDIRDRAREACKNTDGSSLLNFTAQWDDPTSDYPWYQPAVDGLNYLTGKQLKSTGSVHGDFIITDIDCCARLVSFYVFLHDHLRLGSGSRIPEKVPLIGRAEMLPDVLPPVLLIWYWEETISF